MSLLFLFSEGLFLLGGGLFFCTVVERGGCVEGGVERTLEEEWVPLLRCVGSGVGLDPLLLCFSDIWLGLS